MRGFLSRPFEGLLRVPEKKTLITNLSGSSQALFVALMAERYPSYKHIVISRSEEESAVLRRDIHFYRMIMRSSETEHNETVQVPEPDGPEGIDRRLEVFQLIERALVVVGSEKAFTRPFLDRQTLNDLSIPLKVGQTFNRHSLIELLQRAGYRRTAIVTERGQFSERRWVFDVFPSNSREPLRVEFFGEVIDAIKTFDLSSQRSTSSLKTYNIMPAFDISEGPPLIEQIGDGVIFYLTEPSASNIPTSDTVFVLERLPLEETPQAALLNLTGYGLLYRERQGMETFVAQLRSFMREKGYRVLLVVNTEAQASRLKEILLEGDLVAPVLGAEKVASYKGNLLITLGRLSTGFHTEGFLLLTASDIFGPTQFRVTRATDTRRLLESLDEIREGDYIVHREYGIGIFRGMKAIKTMAGLTEAMIIEYRDGARLYLPVYNIGFVHKYRAEEGVIPSLDRLDGKAWKRRKERIRKKIQEMAYRLLNLYARRQLSKAHAFSPDTALHREFEEFFPYEETPDQKRAWEEIRADMETDTPMDRLLCGDVGFGKTEVAMRAAFKAVYDGRQVAVLVPTTLLCDQHYRNFQQRFAPFGVRVDYLSRFKPPADRRKTLQRLKTGEIDIIIGTHLLLSNRTEFRNLGLLIIDEEHRFGVIQKERLKELKRNVHCLTLSATPIPRTLEMALSGIRKMSLIETPPEERLAVKGLVAVFDRKLIKEVIQRELDRNGQVFFVHNRVKDIQKWYKLLKEIIPEARIAIAHGQMRERELEDVMLRFVNGEYDLLLCTSIIGSGIDIPNANTIIINDAHRMGLADLYQLKGRVGRGDRRAYAYFIVPPLEALSAEAKRRVNAIQELNYLGAGLHLAIRDLEIRGAGNLLGREQSGHIHAIGLELYMQMLKEEVAALQGRALDEEPEPQVELPLAAYLPDEYVSDVSERLNLYRRLYQASSEGDLDELFQEMADRFGTLPEEAQGLRQWARLRILCRRLRILSARATRGGIRITIDQKSPINAETLLEAHRKGYPIVFHKDGFSLRRDGLSEDTLINRLQELLLELDSIRRSKTGTVSGNTN